MSELPNHDVRLEVGGKAFTGWSSVDITRSLEQVGWTYSLELYQGATAAEPAVIRPQSSCVVRIDRTPVITGYVDRVRVSCTRDGIDMPVAGRSKTADLVDCHPNPDGPRRWSRIKVEYLAAQLAAEYGVDVVTDASTGAPLDRFALQTNETVYEAIERACGLRQLMLCDDERGRLVITRASSEVLPGALVYGSNVESVSCEFDGSDRYSEYLCRGQRAGGATIDADAAQLVTGRSTDGTSRTRRLVIQPDGRTDAAACKSRAEWEMLTRYGRSTSVTATVPGWRGPDGAVWEINRNIRVRVLPALIDDDLLIVSAQFLRDAKDGTRTTLTLQPREAFAAYTPPGRGRRGARSEKGFFLTESEAVAAGRRAEANR
jgi:prophage tail gpP-like protein